MPPALTSSGAATFDGAATNVTLTNGNLTATHNTTTTDSGARSNLSRNSGKRYCEFTVGQTTGVGDCVGLLTPAGTYTNLVTNSTNCLTVNRAGTIFANNANSGKALGVALAAGNVIGCLIDFTNLKGYIRKVMWNGDSPSNQDPSRNIGGLSFSGFFAVAPMVGFAAASGDVVTFNFGASAFVGEVPLGFNAGWPSAGSPTTLDSATKSAGVTLSGGDLVATHSTATNNEGVRSSSWQSSGKYYFEITWTTIAAVTSVCGLMAGVPAASYTNAVTSASNGVYVLRTTGTIWTNSANSGKFLMGASLAIAAGTVIGFAVDCDNRKVWISRVGWNAGADNPAANNGVTIPASTSFGPVVGFGGTGSANTDNFTGNFGAQKAMAPVPAGSSDWI